MCRSILSCLDDETQTTRNCDVYGKPMDRLGTNLEGTRNVNETKWRNGTETRWKRNTKTFRETHKSCSCKGVETQTKRRLYTSVTKVGWMAIILRLSRSGESGLDGCEGKEPSEWMTKMADFKMTQDVYRKVAPHKGDADKWKQIQAVYEMTDGVSAKDFDAAFDAVAEEMVKVIAREGLEKDAAGMTVTKAIAGLAKDAAEHNLVLTISWDAESEKATISIAGKRGRKASTGDVATGSNISAWTAYQRGKKAGDAFEIRKVDGGYKHKDRFIPKRANGGLKNYILKMFPSSESAKVLAKYGKTLD